MKRNGKIVKVCVVTLVFLCVAQVGAAATVSVDEEIRNEKISRTVLAGILEGVIEENPAEGNGSTLSNMTKQIIRVLLFCGIMFYVLNPKFKKHVLRITLQGGRSRMPLKFQVSDKLVLLGVAAVLALSIYKNMERENGTSNETGNETYAYAGCVMPLEGTEYPLLTWLLTVIATAIRYSLEFARGIIEMLILLIFGEVPEPVRWIPTD